MDASELTAAFYRALPPELALFRTDDSKEILRVPAAAMEVGDLVVYNDGDELTICVGTIFHSHYGDYLAAGDSESEKLQFVMRQAIERIADILADRIRFRVEFEGGRVIGGSSWCITHGKGPCWLQNSDEAREYTWSGEQSHERKPNK
jgi:hypothetical protein